MATVAPTQAIPPELALTSSALAGSIWRAPLVPVALAATAGVVIDHYAPVSLPISLTVVSACVAAWVIHRPGPNAGLPLLYLLLAVTGLAAAYHHWHRDIYPPNDIGNFAVDQARPCRLRGVIGEEPIVSRRPADDPLTSMPHTDPTLSVLQVTSYQQVDDWMPVSGRARLVVEGQLEGVHVGDEVDVVGRIVAPQGPANPGEIDEAARLREQRIRAMILVRKTTDGVTLIAERWPRSVTGWLAVIRGWGQRRL